MLLRTEDVNDARFASTPLQLPAWQMAAKRGSDMLGAATALVVFSPLFVLISILIRLTSPGPILFRWHVVGQGGRPYVGYKFRSMFDGADRAREQLRDKNEMTGVFFKMKNDPRVTSIGRILRRFSLDELPQLWSVLAGHMSLVGPRPSQVFEHQQLSEWQKQRVQMKPGLVSLWIVSGKTQDFDEMVRLDLHYIYHWSIWLDLEILVRALPYVILGKNH
jgi:lipopolysaccharide/colanic/teichoic acid biosynthesis glycosyltransferase